MHPNPPCLSGPRLPRRRAAILTAAALLALARPGHGALVGPDASAQEFIQKLGDRALSILEQGVPAQRKLDELKRLLDQSTDLELIARLVMGRYWRQASEAQRQEYVRLFTDLVMQTMAERLSWYNGQTFQILEDRKVDERDSVVSTRINRPGGQPPIFVDWRVRRSDSRYLLIDIIAEGVSLVVTQRSETAEFISRNGVDGFLAEMRDRVAKRDAART
jgi:phospholipid transport system substrate-binding protein